MARHAMPVLRLFFETVLAMIGCALWLVLGFVNWMQNRGRNKRIADQIEVLTSEQIHELQSACPNATVEQTKTELQETGIFLHVVTAFPKEQGREDAPIVVLLHGFPENWIMWNSLVPTLVQAGYKCIMPDLRGYNLSQKPRRVSDFAIKVLEADVRSLIHHFAPGGKAILIGHDWGGMIAWHVAMHNPNLLERLVIMGSPHPALFRKALLTSPTQQLKSWYILLFMVPFIGEMLLTLNPVMATRNLLASTTRRRRVFNRRVLQYYQSAWLQPGAARAMFAYYRAVLRFGFCSERLVPLPESLPVNVIWGDSDRFLDVGLLKGLNKWAPGLKGQTKLIANCGHWLTHEAPEQVCEALGQALQINTQQ